MMIIKNSTPLLIVVVLFFLGGCQPKPNNKSNRTYTDSNTVSVYTFSHEHGFGYAIFLNNKEFIRQDCIPVIRGNRPFTSQEDAARTGKLVAEKLQHHQLPTLTFKDLEQLHIIHSQEKF